MTPQYYYDLLMKYINEIKTIIYGVFIFLNIDAEVVKILMWLMMIDTVSGLIKSAVLKKEMSFSILFWGLCTKMLILLIPMTLALVGLGLKGYDFTPMVDVVLKVLVVSEGFSIFGNFYSSKTKKEVKNVDIISMLLHSIRNGMMNLIRTWLGRIENQKDDKK